MFYLWLQIAVSYSKLMHSGEAFEKLLPDLPHQVFPERIREAGREVTRREVLHSNMYSPIRLKPSVQLHEEDMILGPVRIMVESDGRLSIRYE